MAGNNTTAPASTGIATWFPQGEKGWSLDVVTLLAVIGESSVAEHSQAITSSFLCLLPRIIPAPQALLRPARPTRMPETNAKLAGVYSGVVLDSVGYFANIIQPLDQLQPFSFKVLEIRHREVGGPAGVDRDEADERHGGWLRRLLCRVPVEVRKKPSRRQQGRRIPGPPLPVRGEEAKTKVDLKASTPGMVLEKDPERGGEPPLPGLIRRRRTVHEKVTDYVSHGTPLGNDRAAARPEIPATLYSPIHVLSLVSFLLTLSLIGLAIYVKDGAAIVAVALVSLAGSVVGYASWWKPVLMSRSHTNLVPRGDVIFRTREGAFVLVRCTEEVARELYLGTEECKYYVRERLYKALMGLGTVLLMVAVILLGNCDFSMQVAISISYVSLNGLYWALGLLPKEYFWDLGRYTWVDITPEDAREAPNATTDAGGFQPTEEARNYTRTLWYAIRETRRTGWVERSGAIPGTQHWKQWLREAAEASKRGDRGWPAVARKNEIMAAAVREGDGNEDEDEADEYEQHRDRVPGGPVTGEIEPHIPAAGGAGAGAGAG